MSRVNAQNKSPHRVPSVRTPREGTGRGSCPEPNGAGTLIWGYSLQNCKKDVSVIDMPPGLWNLLWSPKPTRTYLNYNANELGGLIEKFRRGQPHTLSPSQGKICGILHGKVKLEGPLGGSRSDS